MSKAESEAYLSKLLEYLQSSRRIRVGIAATIVALLVAYGARSAYQLLPRHYVLTISGGDIVSNRHYLAHILADEAAKWDLTLVLKPQQGGTIAVLDDISKGNIDVGFVQGGLEERFANVEHAATIAPELVHLLVRPGLKGLMDLKGARINLGAKASGSREIGLRLTEFAGYVENVDFVETNYGPEALLALPAAKMPDAIVTVSSIPSSLVEILVKKHRYQVVEIPFPEALALHHGWAGKGRILGYAYDLSPPVPEKDIATVAVNIHLLARKGVDPGALSRLLEVLYSASVAGQLRQPLDDKGIAVPSGYPISPGTTAYLKRNDSLLTMENWNKIQGTFGLLMSFSGMGIVVARWFRGTQPKPKTHDEEFHGYVAQVADIERRCGAMDESGDVDQSALARARDTLAELRATVLERYPKANLKDGALFDRTVASIRAADERVHRLMALAPARRAQKEGAEA